MLQLEHGARGCGPPPPACSHAGGGEQVSGGLHRGQAAVREADSHEVGPAPSPEVDAKPVIPREESAVASREERVRRHREFSKGAKTKKWTWFISCSLWQESCQPPLVPTTKSESKPSCCARGAGLMQGRCPLSLGAPAELCSPLSWSRATHGPPGLWTSIMNRVKLLVTSF